MANLLEVDGIETRYGLSKVLHGVSLAIEPGEMVTLMGRNGMGKTTTVRSIMGLTPARAGSIRFDGREIRELPAYRAAKLGLGLVPEGRQLWPRMSVEENLLMGAYPKPLRAAAPEVIVRLSCGLGKASGVCWTCDLSKEYVTINADYHT